MCMIGYRKITDTNFEHYQRLRYKFPWQDHYQVESSLITVYIFIAARQDKMWQKKTTSWTASERLTTLSLWNNMLYILYFSSTFNISYVIQFPFIFFWLHLIPLPSKSLHVNSLSFILHLRISKLCQIWAPFLYFSFYISLGVYSVFSCQWVSVVHWGQPP